MPISCSSDYASELRVYNKNGSLQYKYSFADSYITAVTSG